MTKTIHTPCRGAFTLKIIDRADVPEEKEKAEAAGLYFDAWHPVNGDDEVVAVRLFEDAEDFADAQVQRYLGLLPPAFDA
nr:hypothetical protein [Methylobacterium sp. L1A1]